MKKIKFFLISLQIKDFSWVLFLPLIICWITAYFLSGEQEEIVRISNYSQFINGNIKRNFLVEFDEYGFTSFVKKNGSLQTGSYKYLTKNDTSILVFDGIGGGGIDTPAFLTNFEYQYYEYNELIKEIDSTGFFLRGADGRHLAFQVISGKGDLSEKNENLVFLLVFLPLLPYAIGYYIYVFIRLILWLKKQSLT